MNDDGERKRIVITGIGAVSSAGCTTEQFWHSLTDGSLHRERAQDETNAALSPPGTADFAGVISDFGDLPDARRRLMRKALKLMNRETQMGVSAGQQALSDSCAPEQYDPERFGVCFGADNVSIMPDDFLRGIQACSTADGRFHVERWGEDGIEQMAPLWILKCLPNMPTCHLAILNDLRGPSNTITQRDVSANMAIGEACRSIRAGDADAMLVGATGTTLHAFNLMHAQFEGGVCERDAVCRPFDRRRTGPGPGEGAGAIVLEELQSAVRRGAHIYGEILGTSSASCVQHDSAAGCRRSLVTAMRQTLKRAGQTSESIGHIHAHGLGTQQSDIAEAQAIREVFGEGSQRTPVVAARSHLANASAGAGALELVASLLALRNGHLFPVLNYGEPDPACPVRPVIDYDEPAGSSFLNLSMFGRGLASCVAVRAFAV